MKNLYHKLTAAGSVALLAPFMASAQTPSGGCAGGLAGAAGCLQNVAPAGGTTKTLPELIGSFINALLGVLGIVFVVLVVYAGFLWMTAQGHEENVKRAKTMLTQAIVGIVIIVAAYAISSFVIGTLVTATTGA
jgi:heme/copper-type cytochrome/quinol oxidase subunit 2